MYSRWEDWVYGSMLGLLILFVAFAIGASIGSCLR